MTTFLGILLFIVTIGILIFVHEFGHFITAKLNGIGVTEFAIGMGPKLFSFIKNGTKYSIRLLPFGGYCRMLGQESFMEGEEGVVSDKEHSFSEKPVLRRISVILAGPLMNIILAFVLSIILVCLTGVRTTKVSVMTGSPLAEYMKRDTISITEIDGRSVTDFDDIKRVVADFDGSSVTVKYLEGEEEKTAEVLPQNTENGYALGIMSAEHIENPNASLTLKYGVKTFTDGIKDVLEALGGLFTGKTPLSDLTGPVGMASVMTDMVDTTVNTTSGESTGMRTRTFFQLWIYLLVYLSINVGIINLVPIPALDGGRLVLLIVEGIRGKKLDPKVEAIVTIVGAGILIIGVAAILFKDVFALF